MYKSKVFLDSLRNKYIKEKLDIKAEITDLSTLKSKLTGFSNDASELIDLINNLEDEGIDKKIVSSIDSEYVTIEKSIKSLNVAVNNIISTLKKV